jgi:hypothetical protein
MPVFAVPGVNSVLALASRRAVKLCVSRRIISVLFAVPTTRWSAVYLARPSPHPHVTLRRDAETLLQIAGITNGAICVDYLAS